MSLELHDIVKTYPEFTVNLSLQVQSGGIITLLGPSGCGKTTTLHIIAGFIEPDSGTISLEDKDVTGYPPHRRNIGVVFQDYALFPTMDVFGNIGFGLKMRGWRGDKVKKKVRDLLDLVHLSGYEKRPVSLLSGGEQQRVALARALAPDPHLLLLDEPLSALDAKLRRELRGEIRRIQKKLGLTTVYVTHDQVEALSISDRVAVMNNGRIEQTGTPQEIYNTPRTHFVAGFMGMTNRLHGKITGKTHGYAEIATKLGPFRAPRSKTAEDLAEASIRFRPEACRLISHTQSRDNINTMEGEIRSCEYLGDSLYADIETAAGIMTVLLNPPRNDSGPYQYNEPEDRLNREKKSNAASLAADSLAAASGSSVLEGPLPKEGDRMHVHVLPDLCTLLD